ncbi:Cc8L18.2-like protein, partial [Daphnia magna]
HFWATCHGKNACDGVGGTVKRLARRASLQLSLILTPLDLYNWAVDNIPGIEFVYVTKYIIAADAERLSNKLNSVKLAITGTQKYHFYEQISKGVLQASRTSVQDSGFPKGTFIVLPSLPDRNFVSISDLFVDDYVAVVFMSQWRIGKILDVDYNGVNVKLFSENGPCLNYTWPPKRTMYSFKPLMFL